MPPPTALFERFINADCESCWRDPATPAPSPQARTAVLDWIVPGSQADEAPLSAAATRDALERLDIVGRAVPLASDVHTDAVEPRGRAVLRVARGPAFNDYVGTSITFTPPARATTPTGAGAAPWHFHLLLVESVPAGAEGSPVPRNVVRNMLHGIWDKRNQLLKGEHPQERELRSMRIPEGAQVDRLSLVGWVQDAQGHVVAAAQSVCR